MTKLIDKLLNDVKQARQRANSVKVEPAAIGASLLAFINHG